MKTENKLENYSFLLHFMLKLLLFIFFFFFTQKQFCLKYAECKAVFNPDRSFGGILCSYWGLIVLANKPQEQLQKLLKQNEAMHNKIWSQISPQIVEAEMEAAIYTNLLQTRAKKPVSVLQWSWLELVRNQREMRDMTLWKCSRACMVAFLSSLSIVSRCSVTEKRWRIFRGNRLWWEP